MASKPTKATLKQFCAGLGFMRVDPQEAKSTKVWQDILAMSTGHPKYDQMASWRYVTSYETAAKGTDGLLIVVCDQGMVLLAWHETMQGTWSFLGVHVNATSTTTMANDRYDKLYGAGLRNMARKEGLV